MAEHPGDSQLSATTDDDCEVSQDCDGSKELVLEPGVISKSHLNRANIQDNTDRPSCGICRNIITHACKTLESQGSYSGKTFFTIPSWSGMESEAARGCPDCALIVNITEAYDLSRNDSFQLDTNQPRGYNVEPSIDVALRGISLVVSSKTSQTKLCN
jgi:hypothetical protein